MKKLITFISTLFALATISAAARPSLDGRAVVAESGEMPRGLFARTIGYLPGDSVSVTNPATGSSVDVLILGAIDASEGVAILLSPEAADALNITKDSNVQVKITKRAGSLDEAVSGTAVLSEDEMDFASSTTSDPDENAAEEKPAEEVQKAETAADDNKDNTGISEFEELDENPVQTENAEAAETPEAPEAPEAPAEEVPPVEAVTEDPVAPAESAEEIPQESLPAEKIEQSQVQEPAVEEPAAEQIAPAEELPPAEEENQGEIVIPDELPEEEVPMTSVIADDVPPAEENAEENVVQDEIPEPAENTEPASAAEDVVVPEEIESAVESAEESYNPIVLIPAEDNPPEQEESVVEPVLNASPVASEEVAVPAVEEKPAVAKDYGEYVRAESSLEKGKYYIQIASLANEDNLNALVRKYGAKYPVVLIALSDGKTYRALIGPLGLDEYGSVLEKFRAFGFKDAFLKKIK